MAPGERTDVDSEEGSRADHRDAIRYNIDLQCKADVGWRGVRRGPYHESCNVSKNCLSEGDAGLGARRI